MDLLIISIIIIIIIIIMCLSLNVREPDSQLAILFPLYTISLAKSEDFTFAGDECYIFMLSAHLRHLNCSILANHHLWRQVCE